MICCRGPFKRGRAQLLVVRHMSTKKSTKAGAGRKRKQRGGLLPVTVAPIGFSVGLAVFNTVWKTLLGMAIRYKMQSIMHKLQGPDKNKWVYRIISWMPTAVLNQLIMSDDREIYSVYGAAIMMYLNQYLNGVAEKGQVETIKTQQNLADEASARLANEESNAAMAAKQVVSESVAVKKTTSKAANAEKKGEKKEKNSNKGEKKEEPPKKKRKVQAATALIEPSIN